ncbi:hypothetical protein EAH74_00820 [Pseudomonas mandelii]|uniref:Uncharacterized protein n=1 Tax=Pseudomonas mandelii TaxID=75612 RepID=A0A502IM13_9PSED|nr:hypothetical protein EAH74_00820 [Pseudomonas mandelii]
MGHCARWRRTSSRKRLRIEICGRWAGLFASRLAPTFDLCRTQNLFPLETYCGSEPAREGAISRTTTLTFHVASSTADNSHPLSSPRSRGQNRRRSVHAWGSSG